MFVSTMARRDILISLEKSPMTAWMLRIDAHLNLQELQDTLDQMRQAKEIHISTWHITSTGLWAAVYAPGEGEDAPEPEWTEQQRRTQERIRKRDEERRQRTASKRRDENGRPISDSPIARDPMVAALFGDRKKAA